MIPRNALEQMVTLHQQLHLHYGQNQFAEIAQVVAQLINLSNNLDEKNWGTTDIAVILNEAGMISLSTGNVVQAEQLLCRALDIRKKLLGEGHPDTAQSLNNLAGYYEVQGDYAQAELLYQQALAVKETLFGENHLEVAQALNNVAQIYRTTARFTQAEPLYRRALAIGHICLGEYHPLIGTLLNNLAAFYNDLGDYGQARAYLEKALAVYQLSLDPSHPDLARVLNNLASIHQVHGEYTQAQEYYQQALTIRQKTLGQQHPDVAQTLNNLAVLSQTMGQYTTAISFYQQALTLYHHSLKEDHPATLKTSHNLAMLYHELGDYQNAEKLLQQVTTTLRQRLDVSPLDLATCLHDLAILYHSMGNYARAVSFFQEALDLQITMYGERHPDLATIYHNLGRLHQDQGHYEQAELFYQRALEIWQTSPSNGVNTTALLNSMASLALELGDHTRAEELYQQVIELQRKTLGEKHPSFAATLINLALLNYELDRYTTTIKLCQRALQILQPTVLSTHTLLGSVLNNLAMAHSAMNNYEQARVCYHQALEIWRSFPEGIHPSAAYTLLNLGVLYHATGDDTQAEAHYQQAIGTIHATLGDTHPLLGVTLSNLAVVYAETNRPEEALAHMQEAAWIEDQMIGQAFLISSENRRMAHLSTIRGHLDGLLSFMLHRFSLASIVQITFDVILKRKAIAAEAIATQRDALLSGRYPHLATRLDMLTTLRMQLAQKALAGPGQEGLLQHREQLQEWILQKEQLEAELARSIPEMNISQQLAQVDYKAIARALPPETVLLEFVRFRVFDFTIPQQRAKHAWGPAHYVAFILPSGQPDVLEAIDLGEADPIDLQILRFREAMLGTHISSGTREASSFEKENDTEQPTPLEPTFRNLKPAAYRTPLDLLQHCQREGAALRATLFDPCLARIKQCTRIFLSPDGPLNQLSFETLPLQNGTYVLDAYEICYISTGRDLLRIQSTAVPSHMPSLVVADPDFNLSKQVPDVQQSSTGASATGSRFRDLAQRNGFFHPLPGTHQEGEQIAALLHAQLLTQGNALEAAIKAARSPRILHIATHGFFLPDQRYPQGGLADTIETPSSLGSNRLEQITKIQIENPLLRSGLALAGANTWCRGEDLPSQAEDGLLTAEDVTGLNLADTELVVLSACETGLGHIQRGEGVFGLRRSFLLAGARRLVMSLWKVQDELTQQLMVDFYQRMLSGTSCLEALYQARKELKKHHPHPRDWGAFIYQGDPSPLA